MNLLHMQETFRKRWDLKSFIVPHSTVIRPSLPVEFFWGNFGDCLPGKIKFTPSLETILNIPPLGILHRFTAQRVTELKHDQVEHVIVMREMGSSTLV